MSEVYVVDDPLGPFTLAGHLTDVHGNIMKVPDVCYLADGDQLYFYWFGEDYEQTEKDVEFISGTVGAECDPDAPDASMETWFTLVDAYENDKDLCIDYRTFETVKAYAVRLRIVGTPDGIEPGLVSFTVFGICAHEKNVYEWRKENYEQICLLFY